VLFAVRQFVQHSLISIHMWQGNRAASTACGASACSWGGDENDPEMKPRISALTQTLAGLGWADGRNVRTDPRYAGARI
jgi:hypothetical protein